MRNTIPYDYIKTVDDCKNIAKFKGMLICPKNDQITLTFMKEHMDYKYLTVSNE